MKKSASQKIRALPSPGEIRKITIVPWDSLIIAVDRFASDCTKEYDLIVGIAKGGLPIAVCLAHRLKNVRFSAMLKNYIDVSQDPFFVFKKNPSGILRDDSSILPVYDKKAKRILVVDDVTTFGNSLETAELLIRKQVKDVEVDFFVYALDAARLVESKPKILQRVKCHLIIDNRLEWLQFPWEKE